MNAAAFFQFFTAGEMVNGILLIAVFIRLGRIIRILKR
mgnify:CR=1 FL=1|tara:strand:- start:198 stop:311 length:114 start_codon:yes stop_codon:yes gene_type:complete